MRERRRLGRTGTGRGARSTASVSAALLAASLLVSLAPSQSGAGAASTRPWSAHGSARQVYVLGLAPHERASLITSTGSRLQRKRADAEGGLLFSGVRPGRGYRVRASGLESRRITVHTNAPWPWDPKVYDQKIADKGYQYLTTRDGTKLAIDVHPPTIPAAGPGLPSGVPIPNAPAYAPPYPTLIEYSGYGYADPSGPQNGIAVLANLMGFAVVDVNMRGTGCSGGAFNFFEPLQNLDAYDVIETIANQPWVLGHKVGMMGISYGAISQLFAAQLDPPALEAISPLSTIDATATTLYPGGILNTGFAVAWAEQRQQNAEPAGPHSGEPWAWQRIQGGDKTCAANQALHGEAPNLLRKIRANAYYKPAVADQLDPVAFVHKIKVPVFMACQWEDEQTGAHCPGLVQHMTGTRHKWFFFTNGAHIDSLDPYTYDRWYDFLQLFVAHKAPIVNSAVTRAAAPVIYREAMGLPTTDPPITLPADPIQTIPTYSAALAAFDKFPEVTVLFDNGAGKGPSGLAHPGDPYAAFVRHFSSLPVPGTVATTWYLGPKGHLDARPPATRGANWYTSDAKALALTDYSGNTGSGGLWGNASQWTWRWEQNPSGTAVSYVSAPLEANTTVVGAGAVVLWVHSSTPNVDLQATVSEVRPDHMETFVQNGWIRASERALSTNSDNMFKQPSTLLDPIPSFTRAAARPMPAHGFAKVVIPLYYEGHVYRNGSRIRVTISAPNGTQPVWSFGETVPKGTARVTITFSRTMPSSLVLPVVPHVSVPTGYPACPSLRNEPCRLYKPIVNR